MYIYMSNIVSPHYLLTFIFVNLLIQQNLFVTLRLILAVFSQSPVDMHKVAKNFFNKARKENKKIIMIYMGEINLSLFPDNMIVFLEIQNNLQINY